MKKELIVLCTQLLMAASIEATPSSLFWTNCTTSIQKTGTANLNVDNYFRVIHPRKGDSAFPTDFGVTVGAFSWNNVQGEIGADYIAGKHTPWYFSGKIGLDEEILFSHAPAVNIGIFNAGTKNSGPKRTNENIVDLIFGKSLPGCLGGKLYLGLFSGSKAMGKNRCGVMIGYHRPFFLVKDRVGEEYHTLALCADYASGKNTIGGGGCGLMYYFTPKISILTGPVWFNDHDINGKWKWSVQLDIIFP
jgi:hypothetical protein